MAIGFHTGVLQDKTLDIARVHDQVMTDLLTHGLQKQEQREQEFVQMMSTDFINGLNTKAQEVQLKALREFNDLGTSIYKERGKFGQIKLDDQIKIKKEKDRLQALQDNMRTTLQTFDQARATLAKDAGRNFDITETTSVINQAANEWDGESIIGLDRLLVPAYDNLGDLWKDKVSKLDFQVEGTNIENIEGDEKVTYKKKYASGIRGEQDVVEYLRATSMDGNMRRSALKFITTDALEPDTRQRFEEVVKHYEKMGLKRANISDYDNATSAQLGEAEVLAATSVQQGRFVEKDLMRQELIKREKIEKGVSRSGGEGLYNIEEIAWEVKEGEEIRSNEGVYFSGNRQPIIEVEGHRIEGAEDKGVVAVSIIHVGDDGTLVGKYKGSVRVKESEVPVNKEGQRVYIPVMTKDGSELNKAMAVAEYNDLDFSGTVVDAVIDNPNAPKSEQNWIPVVRDDQGRTVYLKMKDDYKEDVLYKRMTSQATNLDATYSQRRGTVQKETKKETANDSDPLGLGI